MKIIIFAASLFMLVSSVAYADVGCGPSPRPNIEKIDDTADDSENSDTGEEQDSGEEARWTAPSVRLSILFGPVVVLALFARRKE